MFDPHMTASQAAQVGASTAYTGGVAGTPTTGDPARVALASTSTPPGHADPSAATSERGFGDALAELAPDGTLARLLEGTDCEKLDDHALVEVVAAWRRIGSWAAAQAALAAASLAARAAMNPPWPDLAGKTGERCVAGEELALRLGCSRRAGRDLVRAGRAYGGDLWPTGEALERGDIDEGKARLVRQALADVPLVVAVAVQEQVLPDAHRRTHMQLARDLERALIEADADDADDRAARAVAERAVSRPRRLPNGMAGLWATLPAAAAVALSGRLDAVARSARDEGDGRTLEQLRADALCVSVLGDLLIEDRGDAGPSGSDPVDPADLVAPVDPIDPVDPVDPVVITSIASAGGDRPAAGLLAHPEPALGPSCVCGGDAGSSVARRVTGRPLRTELRVTVSLDALLGTSSSPADLEGHGPITATAARALARDGTWRRLVTDPMSGALLDVGRTRYRPPADLDEHVRTRDGSCVRPGCVTPATRCDLDHTIPFHAPDSATADGGSTPDGGAPGHGSTSEHNLGALCRTDHLLKTHGGFRLVQVAPGVFEWTTPTRHRYTRQPEGLPPPPAAASSASALFSEPNENDGRPAVRDKGGPPPF